MLEEKVGKRRSCKEERVLKRRRKIGREAVKKREC